MATVRKKAPIHHASKRIHRSRRRGLTEGEGDISSTRRSNAYFFKTTTVTATEKERRRERSDASDPAFGNREVIEPHRLM